MPPDLNVFAAWWVCCRYLCTKGLVLQARFCYGFCEGKVEMNWNWQLGWLLPGMAGILG